MLHPDVSNHKRTRGALLTCASVIALLAVTVLGVLCFSPRPSSAARKSLEQRNLRHPVAARRSNFAPTSRTMTNPAPVFATVTVDRTDDPSGALLSAASLCTAALNDCSLRGAVAYANANVGTTISVPAGTYNLTISGAGEGFNGDNTVGDLDITATTTTITGAGAATTVIHQTTAGDRVIEINPFLDANFITDISGVTISGGNENTGVGGGGIISGSIDNVLTLTNCIVSGNSATGAFSSGGGGVSHLGGALNISGCTFSSNSTTTSGGAISYSAGDPFGRTPSTGTITISGSTFSSNTASSTAAGGGALDLFDFNSGVSAYAISTSSFSSNNAGGGNGGAIIVESGGPLTVTTSTFANNHAASFGGAILGAGTSASVQYSRMVGNTATLATNGRTIFYNSGTFSADDNWWGVNTGPAANDFRNTSGAVTVADFLKLRASASPSSICAGSSSTISADIKARQVGVPLTTELNGIPPFPATFTNTTPAVGNVTGASANFVNGAASATFNGTANGTAMIDVAADSQTVTTNVSVESNATSDPADQIVCQGATATFSTTASGPGPFTYAWTVDGSPAGTNSPTLNVDTTSLSTGNHTVSVTTTGACGSANQSATLTVNAPTTTSDPADQTVCEGATASFATTAGGTGPFTYAWTVDGNPAGTNSPTLNVNTTGFSATTHTVSVTTTGACGSASQSANLIVQASATTTDPVDQTVCAGATASFSTTAGGTGPFTYAWTVDGNSAGTTPSINVNTTGFSAGNHTVSVTTTGACGSASQSATLAVQAVTTTTGPADQTVCQGATASFSTTAGGTGPFSYAWKVDGSPAGTNSPSLNVPTGSLSVGDHTVSVTTTGTCGTASQSATLTVQANTTASDPADQTVCQGATASFSTTASGTDIHYAWTVDGSPFNGDSDSINVPTGSLSIGNHNIGLTVTGACGTVLQTATLTVQANTTASDPADQTVCQGATASFSTTASGTDIHYAWTLDGSSFNGDSDSINVPTGSLSVGSHNIGLTVSGTCGTVSHTATLTVQATTTTTDPADQSVCEGATANFSTTAGGTGPFHYAWTVDGNPYNGDSFSISVNTTGYSQGAHTVTVTTTGSCGSAFRSATLTVHNNPPVINVANSLISVWPPNHQYQNFTLADFGVTASSSCDGNLTSSIVIVSVTSDELDDNPGGADGSTVNDILIANDCKSVQLRRERDGGLDGRVYTVTFAVTDSVGHTTTATAQVVVPLNQSGGSAVNSGVNNTVNGTCP